MHSKIEEAEADAERWIQELDAKCEELKAQYHWICGFILVLVIAFLVCCFIGFVYYVRELVQ